LLNAAIRENLDEGWQGVRHNAKNPPAAGFLHCAEAAYIQRLEPTSSCEMSTSLTAMSLYFSR
jgi:hypothetical protein